MRNCLPRFPVEWPFRLLQRLQHFSSSFASCLQPRLEPRRERRPRQRKRCQTPSYLESGLHSRSENMQVREHFRARCYLWCIVGNQSQTLDAHDDTQNEGVAVWRKNWCVFMVVNISWIFTICLILFEHSCHKVEWWSKIGARLVPHPFLIIGSQLRGWP